MVSVLFVRITSACQRMSIILPYKLESGSHIHTTYHSRKGRGKETYGKEIADDSKLCGGLVSQEGKVYHHREHYREGYQTVSADRVLGKRKGVLKKNSFPVLIDWYLVLHICVVDKEIQELEAEPYSVDQCDGEVWLCHSIHQPERTAATSNTHIRTSFNHSTHEQHTSLMQPQREDEGPLQHF